MSPDIFYNAAGICLFGIGMFGVLAADHVLRKLIAINMMGIGVFMVFLVTAHHGDIVDPVPHAMVLTGIVVAVAGTALCLWLAVKIRLLSDLESEEVTDDVR